MNRKHRVLMSVVLGERVWGGWALLGQDQSHDGMLKFFFIYHNHIFQIDFFSPSTLESYRRTGV